MEPKVYTLLGRAGCGKGTQAKLLTDKFGLTYIGSGEILRALSGQENFNGKKIKEVISRGQLAPTFLIFQQWVNRLGELKLASNKDLAGILFDGSPRKLVEAQMMEEAILWYEWDKNFKAILVDISREEAFNRLTKRRQCVKCGQLIPYVGEYKNLKVCDKCGGELVTRQDDTPEAINLRLDLFDQEVLPVINFFEANGRLLRINGEQPIDKVFEEILSKLQ
ncbi:MAG TPA: nucleoside monophosphate kinase [Candidatus Portnoybacteria bacterium]|nr:nucleoside monophosphate kinase [Candidatus Portnoybacteria bacterium]